MKWFNQIAMAFVFSLLVLPSHATLLTWDNGGVDNSFTNADNWNPDQAPVSGSDSLVFGSGGSGTPSFTSSFTIGSGQTFNTDDSFVFRLGDGSHLTLATGGTLDFITGGNGIFAESGDLNQRLTLEAGATARTDQYFDSTGWTTEFVANAAGVTTFEVAGNFFLRGGPLEVDLSSYDISNGSDLILFDYGNSSFYCHFMYG